MINFDQDDLDVLPDDLDVLPPEKKPTTTKGDGAKRLFKLTAKHAGLEVVTFIIEAEDRKDAFSKFKSIVFSHKQWIVTNNEEIRTPVERPLSHVHEEEDLV
jgi:hypothetical protein